MNLTMDEIRELNQLPNFIEHRLVQHRLGKAAPWAPDHEDPVWQAICRYYELALNALDFNSPEDQELARNIQHAFKTGRGVSGDGSMYPYHWDPFLISYMRDPLGAAWDCVGNVADNPNWLPKNLPNYELIPHEFLRWLQDKQPGNPLQLSQETSESEETICVFDDGSYCSAIKLFPEFTEISDNGRKIEPKRPIGAMLGHATLDQMDVRREIWRRWDGYADFAPPPDIVAEDGQRFDGLKVVIALLPDFVRQVADMDPILCAAAKWENRDKQVEQLAKAIATVFEVLEGKMDRDFSSQYTALSQTARELISRNCVTGCFL